MERETGAKCNKCSYPIVEEYYIVDESEKIKGYHCVRCGKGFTKTDGPDYPLRNCNRRDHPFEKIYSSGSDDSMFGEEAVMWCPTCGSIVVDRITDGRVAPGVIVPIRNPQNMTLGS